MKALLLYSSQEGQTRKIIERIAQQMPEYDCDIQDLHQVHEIALADYEKILIGASIRYGRLNEKLYQFIQRHVTTLTFTNADFFCVYFSERFADKL